MAYTITCNKCGNMFTVYDEALNNLELTNRIKILEDNLNKVQQDYYDYLQRSYDILIDKLERS